MTDVTVIGGGLAGMAAALRLAERGCAVTLYEKSDRLGGKAGANQAFGEHDDHGFHIFPPWYLNIWQLVDELKIRDNFVDLHDFVQLSGNDYRTRNVDQFKTLHDAAAFKNVWRNLMSSPLPFHQTLLFFFSTIDLATHRFNQRAKLDQISITGFLRYALLSDGADSRGVSGSHAQGHLRAVVFRVRDDDTTRHPVLEEAPAPDASHPTRKSAAVLH